MSSSKLDTSGAFNPVKIQLSETQLSIPTADIRVRKSGIEFLSVKPVPIWTEMTVDLYSPETSRKVHCTGVVVGCTGNRHTGFLVSIIFMNLSRQSQHCLEELDRAQSV
ncbi:MAG: hypothetical protein O2960_23845 [Verrucomicrobia bacterium]|nr:hypothetical protein [Verrucomicrobiota bacterium]